MTRQSRTPEQARAIIPVLTGDLPEATWFIYQALRLQVRTHPLSDAARVPLTVIQKQQKALLRTFQNFSSVGKKSQLKNYPQSVYYFSLFKITTGKLQQPNACQSHLQTPELTSSNNWECVQRDYMWMLIPVIFRRESKQLQ